MMTYKKIKVGAKTIEVLVWSLMSKNLIVLKGRRGYIMCGYLNLRTAQKCNDIAVKITGVATIQDALKARVAACTRQARRIGVYKGQPVKDVLRLIV